MIDPPQIMVLNLYNKTVHFINRDIGYQGWWVTILTKVEGACVPSNLKYGKNVINSNWGNNNTSKPLSPNPDSKM